jgi:4-amino-4-deoxy-L-arabinose transferase-like glycosyltransferase
MSGASRLGIDRREAWGLLFLLAVAAPVLGRSLGTPSAEFDEGVYLLSTDLLARGFELGGQVFSSQPPLFLTILDVVNWVAGGSVAVLRGAALAIALAGTLAGWALVRRIAGPRAAFAASALLLLSPGVVDAAAVVSADVPSVAVGTAALLAARLAPQRTAWAAVAGALLAAALLIKLLTAPFALGILAGAIVRPPTRAAVAAFFGGALAVVGLVAAMHFDQLGELWAGAVGLHLEARAASAIEAQVPDAQVILISLAYAGLLSVLLLGLRRVESGALREWTRERADLIAVLTGGLLLVALHRPLLHHHLVILAWPLALLAGSALPRGLPPRRYAVLGLAAMLIVPWAVHGRDTVDGSDRVHLETAAGLVAEVTDPDDAVVSDLPLVPLLADRPTALPTADPSFVRVSTGSLDRAGIVAAARDAGAAVVGRSFASVPGLQAELAALFEARTSLPGGIVVFHDAPAGASPAAALAQAGW